jgi:hypothetical protein
MKRKLEVFIRGYEHLTPKEKHRARRADAICEGALEEVGVKMDAFQKLPVWVEFVEGQIGEKELWERVLTERDQYVEVYHKAA